MGIFFEKLFAQLLFWLYDFIDTIGAIFNILTGTQKADETRTLLEIFMDSAITTQVMLGLCAVGVVIAGACVGVKVVKNIIKFKAGGEPSSHATAVKQGLMGVGASLICIFFVFMFISFSTGLLNMINGVIMPKDAGTLSQELFNLSVQQSYVIDESVWEEREVGDYLDESGHRVQQTDPESDDGLAWLKDGEQEDYMLEDGYTVDENGYVLDPDGQKIPVWVQKIERYHPYMVDDNGNYIYETGWCKKTVDTDWCAKDLKWSMSPDEVFGIHNKDWLGLFEQADQGYSQKPMVRLESFNMFTAYLVAIVMLISIFMLSVGLVKRIYDIIVLFICMPLVCGTIPLDDGARFRAWRETFMSKVLMAFGAVVALNVFFSVEIFIMGPGFGQVTDYLVAGGVLSDTAVTIFKMVLILGGALCINSSQSLIARILGTSADESREAMQSFAIISGGVRMGAMGVIGAGRVAGGISRGLFGGTNRYGRQRTGLFNYGARGVNAIGEHFYGERYSNTRSAAFIRALGRMGNRMPVDGSRVNATDSVAGRSSSLSAPQPITGISTATGIGEHEHSASTPFAPKTIAISEPLGGSQHSSDTARAAINSGNGNKVNGAHANFAYNDNTKRRK